MLIREELQEAAWSPGDPGAQWILILWRVYKHQLWVITRRTDPDSSCLESWKGPGGSFRGSWGRGARALDARGRPWPTLAPCEGMWDGETRLGWASRALTPHWHGKKTSGFSSSSPCSPSEQGIPKAMRILAAWTSCDVFRVLVLWDLVCWKWGGNNSRKNDDVCNRWFGDHPTGKVPVLEGKANGGAEFLNFLIFNRWMPYSS